MKNLSGRMAVVVAALVIVAMMPAGAFAQIQIPGLGSLDKGQLLEQSKKLVAELTSMKSSGKLDAPDPACRSARRPPEAVQLAQGRDEVARSPTAS